MLGAGFNKLGILLLGSTSFDFCDISHVKVGLITNQKILTTRKNLSDVICVRFLTEPHIFIWQFTQSLSKNNPFFALFLRFSTKYLVLCGLQRVDQWTFSTDKWNFFAHMWYNEKDHLVRNSIKPDDRDLNGNFPWDDNPLNSAGSKIPQKRARIETLF